MLNRVCNLHHWQEPETRAAMRQILPYFAEASPDYPDGIEHRKHWEYAQILNGLRRLGATGPESWLLSVAGGHEECAYFLTNEARWVFLNDIYGAGTFTSVEADAGILVNPDRFARVPYNRRRLVVQYMDALDLRHEAETFDGVFCSSSVEHFGSIEKATEGLAQMARVLKTGGVAAVTTECVVNSAEAWITPNLILFTPELLEQWARSVPGLELVEPISFAISPETLATRQSQEDAVAQAREWVVRHPHIVLEREGRWFTSVSLFWRKH